MKMRNLARGMCLCVVLLTACTSVPSASTSCRPVACGPEPAAWRGVAGGASHTTCRNG
jgi:curli biogenesis system outer membrane secretion channel CsgG